MSERIAVEGTTTYRLARLLEAAKLREAELQDRIDVLEESTAALAESGRNIVQERDAALSVFPAIRVKLVSTFGGMGPGSSVWGQTQYDKGYSAGVLAALTAFDTAVKQLPASAALAERDRAIVQRCINLARNTVAYESWFEMATREFGLEPKTETPAT